MKKSIGMILVVAATLTLAGCQSQTKSTKSTAASHESVNYVQKGLTAVKDNDLAQAEQDFKKVGSHRAKQYLKQLQYLDDAQKAYDRSDYQLADQQIVKGLKVEDGSPAITSKLQKLDQKVQKRLKRTASQSSQAVSSSSSSQAAASSSSTTNAADHQKAEELRQNIVSSSNGAFDADALEKVPDSVVLAAEKQASAKGGDVGMTGNLIAQQYPDVKASTNSSETTEQTLTHDVAMQYVQEHKDELDQATGYDSVVSDQSFDSVGMYIVELRDPDNSDVWYNLDLKPDGTVTLGICTSMHSNQIENWK
ncbi:hypothetical protein IV38_GL001021 [Lactobacillus selangorensis]|uniref:Lipoprotein n=1 Tax=Lactobacillus selangorensis TaxID=81857 RepID=A0A0R2FJT1_9LACO|nr:hypothetical protein [Lactobacillus selangorensis]KRN28816.1 hypothetical protein IV38_GL001021 [Lactobacillus selangorensis]KRN32774.1 hypothetical protein IV40_GL000832 [Lactobacillus selangorensis]